MLTGTAAWIAMLGTISVVLFIVITVKRTLRRWEEEERAEESAFVAGLTTSRIDHADAEGMTPLLKAIDRDWPDAMEQVLQRHPDPNRAGAGGFTPLHLAARQGDPDLVQRLLDLGAGVDPRNDSGQTPLWLAAAAGSVPVIELLHAHGAGVNDAEPTHKHTPLMIAAMAGRAAAVECLLALGADAQAQDKDGATAADLGEEYLGRNMGAYVEANHALKNMVMHLRAAELGRAFTPYERHRPSDEHDAEGPDG